MSPRNTVQVKAASAASRGADNHDLAAVETGEWIDRFVAVAVVTPDAHDSFVAW